MHLKKLLKLLEQGPKAFSMVIGEKMFHFIWSAELKDHKSWGRQKDLWIIEGIV